MAAGERGDVGRDEWGYRSTTAEPSVTLYARVDLIDEAAVLLLFLSFPPKARSFTRTRWRPGTLGFDQL